MNKERIIKGKKGYRYESKTFGCYDRGMPPHPTWDKPSEYEVTGLAGNKIKVKVRDVFYIGSRPQKIKGKVIQRMVFTATYHPYPDFMFPAKLDLMSEDTASAKLSKNERASIVLYMSPVKRNSFAIQTCAFASESCEAVCLDYSGQKVGQMKQRAAIARTDMYFAHRDLFWGRIYNEIQAFRKKRNPTGKGEIAVRLNGTSDLDLFSEFIQWCIKNKKTLQKDLVFYDYTKYSGRVTLNKNMEYFYQPNGKDWVKNPLNVRHKVTYSLSEDTKKNKNAWKTGAEILMNGGTIAAVFLVNPKGSPKKKANNWVKIKDKWYAPLPSSVSFVYDGKKYTFPVEDGDASDDLMLDIGGSKVLGLRAKQRATKDTSGFAIPVFALRPDGQNEMINDIYLELDVNKDEIRQACNLVSAPVPDFKCSDDQTGSTIKTW